MRAYWRHLVNRLTGVHNPNSKSIGSAIFAQLTAVSSSMSGHVLFPNNCPFARRIGTASNTRFLGPTRVHNLNGISIGSALFAQFMSESECRRHDGACPSPSKLPLPMGICTPIQYVVPWSTRLSIPNGISIGSAVFAQLTAKSPYTLQ